MIYRMTFGFAGQGVGWSETHAVKSIAQSPLDLVPVAIQVAQKRASFLGREFAINAVRISTYSDDTGTNRAKGVFLLKQEFRNPVQDDSQSAEPANVAVVARCATNATIAPPGFAANTARTYCGAPPDPAVSDAGIVDPGVSNLGTNFTQWALALLNNGFGWLASATVTDQKINAITQNADGTVEIQVNGPVPGGIVLGSTYPARARRINGGQSPLNGPLVCNYTAVDTFNTTEIIGLALVQTGGNLKVYRAIQPFIPYSQVLLDLETAKHSRSRPFGSVPGRARKRIRG